MAVRQYLSTAPPSDSGGICIGGPLLQIIAHNFFHHSTLVSAGRQYQGSVLIKFLSFKAISAARRYNWNSQRSVCRLTFYLRIALCCRQIQTCGPCFFFFYRRIDPSYGSLSQHPLSSTQMSIYCSQTCRLHLLPIDKTR